MEENTQILIIRQSCLRTAVEFTKDTKDFGYNDVMNVAEEFEEWVCREEKKEVKKQELLTDEL